ncbi:hypothetical protein IFT48_03890 [Pseudomonas fluorescens]|uniref:hypothetical protein n=1 Tax=Pseudomonas fluorescens TaxID=294 RepID=UPI0019309E05|nr:hypothetical protein [Pseudomonas fluorescens]MBD8089112.1 hypothetical protein [Pseudomonas fluorescens]
MKVMIGGIEYVPKVDVAEITDERLHDALRQLVYMQYLNETHKLRAQAWDVLNTLAPDLAQLSSKSPKAAYDRMHPEDQE